MVVVNDEVKCSKGWCLTTEGGKERGKPASLRGAVTHCGRREGMPSTKTLPCPIILRLHPTTTLVPRFIFRAQKFVM
jgi:hypothetical protein